MHSELYVITGPTACGKTAVSIELAKRINGEIISADSMQVYKYMDIGTAKVTPKEMRGIKHYMIDELYPDEEFSVAIFQKMAKKYIAEIKSKGKIPIIAGGTGFYINALLYDTDFTETHVDTEYRNKLCSLAQKNGNDCVHDMLRSVDPSSAESIHTNNLKRVIRALEYYKQTGCRISEHNMIEKQRKIVYNVSIKVLNPERKILYEKVDARVENMLRQGLVEEVKSLLAMGYHEGLTSMQGLGYKETVDFLKENVSRDEMIYRIKLGTRHFAKRQLTWFRNSLFGEFVNIEPDMTNEDICNAILSNH